MPDTVITANIDRHLRVRKSDSSGELDAVKEGIFDARGATFPDLQGVETIASELATAEFQKLASMLAHIVLNGQRILVVGKASSEVILSAACFQRGIQLLVQAMGRTRDVVTTSRGDLGAWRSGAEVNVVLGSLESQAESLIRNHTGQQAPDLVLLLNPAGSVSSRIGDMFDAAGDNVPIAGVSTLAGCIDDASDQLNVSPVSGGDSHKRYTLCCVLHFLLLRVRDEVSQSIASHPRNQALVAQLQSSGLETNVALAGLSVIMDDMPMTAPMRLMVRSGLEQINRGWSLPARTAHSRGLLSYGLRSLLTESGADYPFTSREIALCLAPFFQVMALAGDTRTLIECLLTNDRKVANDKSAKAALLASKADFPSFRGSSDAMPALTEPDEDWGDACDILYSLRTERNDSLSEALLPVVAGQNCSQLGGVYLLVSSKTEDADRVHCYLRSRNIHLADALVALSFASGLMKRNPEWEADTLYASLELDEAGLAEFEASIRDYLGKVSREHTGLGELGESDGPLGRKQRVFALAHWIEKQPWGKGFPEPVFAQDFRVIKVLTHMDSHQYILVDDMSSDIHCGEGFTLLWRDSVSGNVPTIRQDQEIRVRYRLLVDRNKNANDIFGLVDTLREVGDQ